MHWVFGLEWSFKLETTARVHRVPLRTLASNHHALCSPLRRCCLNGSPKRTYLLAGLCGRVPWKKAISMHHRKLSYPVTISSCPPLTRRFRRSDTSRPEPLPTDDTYVDLVCRASESWPALPWEIADDIDINRTPELLPLDIRAFINSTIPFFTRLPVEVLAMIFDVVAADPDNTPHAPVDIGDLRLEESSEGYTLALRMLRDTRLQQEITARGSLGWVRLGHVCHQWREVLNDMRALWARILGRLPLGDEEILARAGDQNLLDVLWWRTPFHFHAQTIFEPITSPRPKTASYTLALPYANRLRCVRFVNFGDRKVAPPSELFDVPSFPSLDTLEMSYTSPDCLLEKCITLSSQTLIAPRLRVLRLLGCYVPWQSSMLERLTLHRIDSKTLPALTLFGILDQTSATLKYLDLYDTFIREDELEHEYSGEIILSRLRVLSISTRSGHLPTFLRFVKLPVGVQLIVDFYVEIDDDWLEDDGPYIVESRRELQSDIEAALAGCHYDTSLDGLVITQGDPTDAFDELYFHMHRESLDILSMAVGSDASDPFDVNDASLALLAQNGFAHPDNPEDRGLIICCSEMARSLNPERFATISIDVPMWGVEHIYSCVSLFPNLRALRVVNPLEYHGVRSSAGTPTAFPFRNSLLAGTKQACTTDDPDRSVYVLDVLWLVEPEHRYYSRFTTSCSSWCKLIAGQLHEAFRNSGSVAGTKPIHTLRIDYLADVQTEEGPWHAVFADFAEVVVWRTGRAAMST